MSQDASARLGLPYLLAGQLQKHVTLNEALTRLDLLVQTAVQSRSATEPPADPADGALYIIGEEVEAVDWADFGSGDLIRFELGHWLKQAVPEGTTVLILDEAIQVAWLEGAWTEVGAPDLEQLQGISRFGLNTSADANNPFAARLNKALWTALDAASGGDGDLRFTFNKEGASDVLSLLFQSNWGGRAELGLIGEDNFSLKVSGDGASWHDALSVERNTGRVSFAKGAVRRETTTATTNQTWSLPAWARWVEVVCIAGGGGGGAGLGGASGGHRLGGGGGGAGGVVRALWPASSLGAALSLSIGAGGAGGSGNGNGGGFGGNSEISLNSQTLIKAYGGHGGAAGSASEGRGGYGGAGATGSNGGGNSGYLTDAYGGEAFTKTTGPGGGGGGGSVSNANLGYKGGEGGAGGVVLSANSGGAASAAAGNAGGAMSDAALNPFGGGGGGGAGSGSGAGFDGGVGGLYGAGGGGGGGGLTTGGAGGAGGAGVIILTAVG